jgi:uncharacterized integral membrane protein
MTKEKMKTSILILLMAMSLHSFSQERFSKRKYRKGMFIEKITHIKQKKATEITSPPNISLACRAIMEEKKAPENEDVITRHDTVIVADSYEHVDPASMPKHTSEPEADIIKHNTLKLSAGEAYCSKFSQLNMQTNRQMVEQELKTRSVVMQKMSDQSMMGGFFGDLFEEIKRFFLICLLIIMVFALFASVMAITTYPVASLSWGFGIAACIYATMGIIISITALIDRDGGKFMQVLKIIFCIASCALIFGAGAG